MKITTLELLNKIAPENVNKSRVESIRNMFLDYRFTINQKRAIELFIFEPTEEQAFNAMEISPKAWLFIRHVVSDGKIVAEVSDWVEQGKVKKMYIRTIITNQDLKDLLELLLQSPCKDKIEKYMKKIKMEQKLKR